MRTMTNSFQGRVFYESSFDPKTGQLVRVCETGNESDSVRRFGDGMLGVIAPERQKRYTGPDLWEKDLPDEERDRRRKLYDEWRKANPTQRDIWNQQYSWNRQTAFSPVPETIDVKITNNCSFGCPNCYMDSKPGAHHAPFSLIETVFSGLDIAPYQIALGGGEPTLHPDLPAILEYIRGKETVPNYTTAGYKWRKDVIDATNKYCGGVALSYHPHKGIDYFVETFQAWREALKVQLNVHVIADKNGAESLRELLDAFTSTEGLHPDMLNLVLLAYYPNVGRASNLGLMRKTTYMVDLPREIKRAISLGAKVAFSEGLLPFFFSRPELGLTLTYATAMEGRFSCYVDNKGDVSVSSFDPPGTGRRLSETNIYRMRFQEIWNKHIGDSYGPGGAPCGDCVYGVGRCKAPDDSHMFMCAWQLHNNPTTEPPLTREAQRQRAFWAAVEVAREKEEK